MKMARSYPKTLWEKEKLPVMSNFSLSHMFQKDLDCRHLKTKACLGKHSAIIERKMGSKFLHENAARATTKTLFSQKTAKLKTI